MRYQLQAWATLDVIDKQPDHLRLEPNPKGPIELDQKVAYTAFAVAKDGTELGEVTGQTDFSISQQGQPSAACPGATCTPTKSGKHTVTGRLRDHRPVVEGTATLDVIDRPTTSGTTTSTSGTTTESSTTTTESSTTTTTESSTTTTSEPTTTSEATTTTGKPTTTGEPTTTSESTTTTSESTTTTSKPTTTTSKPTTTTSKPTTTTTAPTTTSTTLPPTTTTGRETTTTTSGRTTTTTPASQPVISSVQPGFTFAGMSVEVGGNTGSCSRAGTLTFHGNTGDVSVKVTADQQGNFVARVTIPKGTFPTAHKLELTVDCNGQLQRAQGDLSVLNIAPTAANDSAKTIQDTPVSIPVTDNDRNPDPDTGYPTRVLESSPPTHGTTEVLPDNRIRYSPDKGFVGQDQFQYGFCDDILNAAGQADCGTATVTVTVTDAQACLPSPGDISNIKVNPSKGPGGKTLSITATVDRKLAACPFRLLLGGTPLGPDLPAGPDGSITAEREVPKDAKPGPSVMRLTTMGAQTLAETPFEVVPAGPSLPLKLLIGAGALVAGALARAAFRRWRPSRQRSRVGELPDDLRAEPHTRPVEVTVAPEHDNTRTFTVRLEPHPDPGNQTLQEMNP